MSKQNQKTPSLEEAFVEITQLIEKMEQNELTLEQSLNHFERGIHLIKHCQKILEKAEQKVSLLIAANQQEELTPFTEAEKKSGQTHDNNE